MAKGKVGRSSKIDKDTMKAANISFAIVVIILLFLYKFPLHTKLYLV